MLDHEREITLNWLRRKQAVGYVTCADRFAGTLRGVRERLGYLQPKGWLQWLEAIVAPRELLPYLGVGTRGKECDLAITTGSWCCSHQPSCHRPGATPDRGPR